MSPSEKGYYKKYTSSQGRHDYLMLFDAIASMDEYDEGKLRKKLRNKDFARHLARTKNYLYHSVIKVLLLYHEESSPRIVIRNLLNEVDMLHNRGLLNQTEKIIEKAKTLAVEGEWFLLWMEAVNYQRRLKSIIALPQEVSSEALLDEFNSVSGQFNNYNRYHDIMEQLLAIVRSSILVREQDKKEKIQELMQLDLLSDESKANSVKSRIQFNYINYFARTLMEGSHSSYPYALRLYQILTENKKLSSSNPQFLLDAYNNILITTQSQSQSVIHEKYLTELRTTEVKNSWLNVVKFQYYSGFALRFYATNQKKNDFLETAKQTLHNLKLYKHAVKEELRLAMYVMLADGYVAFGEYGQCIDVVEIYRQNPPKNIRYDYQNYLMFFYLISQYETGNFQLVKNLISNVSRFMKRVGEFSEIEGFMLKVFGVLLAEPDKSRRASEITALKNSIIQKADEYSGARWHNYLDFMVPFIESKVQGIKYHSYLSQNHKSSRPA
jgi:hypothetical protein